MGILMSFMTGKGLSSTQLLNTAVRTLYDGFINEDIKNFDDFHAAVLEIFKNIEGQRFSAIMQLLEGKEKKRSQTHLNSTMNMALSGKHYGYDAPTHEEVKKIFEKWKKAKEEDKRQIFEEFMKNHVTMKKVDGSMMMTGIVVPPAAMLVKRSVQSIPQLKVIKVIPDVVFVPSATVSALKTVKLARKILQAKMISYLLHL